MKPRCCEFVHYFRLSSQLVKKLTRPRTICRHWYAQDVAWQCSLLSQLAWYDPSNSPCVSAPTRVCVVSDAHAYITNRDSTLYRSAHHGLVALLSQFARKRKMLGVGAARAWQTFCAPRCGCDEYACVVGCVGCVLEGARPVPKRGLVMNPKSYRTDVSVRTGS